MSPSDLIKINERRVCVFLIICGLLFSPAFTVEISSSSNTDTTTNGSDSVSRLSEIVMNSFVATTPKIDVVQTKAPSR